MSRNPPKFNPEISAIDALNKVEAIHTTLMMGVFYQYPERISNQVLAEAICDLTEILGSILQQRV